MTFFHTMTLLRDWNIRNAWTCFSCTFASNRPARPVIFTLFISFRNVVVTASRDWVASANAFIRLAMKRVGTDARKDEPVIRMLSYMARIQHKTIVLPIMTIKGIIETQPSWIVRSITPRINSSTAVLWSLSDRPRQSNMSRFPTRFH